MLKRGELVTAGLCNSRIAMLLVALLAAIVLTNAAVRRSFEYDEAYSVFVTSGIPRPAWPAVPFIAGSAREAYTDDTSLATIANALRQTDVHPPAYFWALRLWRDIAGNSLIAERMLSVLFGLATLAVVGVIAVESGLPPALSMLLTLGCYGFAYTSAIARGFALAELLMLAGVLLTLQATRKRSAVLALAAGLLLGAASFTNYLATFAGVAAMLWLVAMRVGRLPLWLCAAIGLSVWMPADLWFFLAQRNSRTGQFPPFEWVSGLTRLARYAAGAVFGGLPLYVQGTAQMVLGTVLAAGLIVLVAAIVARWRILGTAASRLLLGMCAVATPVGLMVLGLIFNNTPIELRYFSFSVPFFALLVAGTLAGLPRTIALTAGTAVLGVQCLAIIGLLIRPETMQPARATASAASRLAEPDGLVLLSRGNDGVGIVGPFLYEAPRWLPVLLVGSDTTTEQVRTALAEVRSVVLATAEPDAESRIAVRVMRAAIASPCWQKVGSGFSAVAYRRICDQ